MGSGKGCRSSGFAEDVGAAILQALKAMVNNFIIDPINQALEFHIGGSILGQSWGIDIDPPDIPTWPPVASSGPGPAAPWPFAGRRRRGRGGDPLSRAGAAVGGTVVHIHGNVYGVDDLIYQMDRALKRSGQAGLVATGLTGYVCRCRCAWTGTTTGGIRSRAMTSRRMCATR